MYTYTLYTHLCSVGPNPSLEQRLLMVEEMLELCTKVYEEDTFQEPEPPKPASLPRDHMRPMGIMTLADLGKYIYIYCLCIYIYIYTYIHVYAYVYV